MTTHTRSRALLAEIARLRKELESHKAENSRLHRLLGVTGRSVVPDQPSQGALFVGVQGRVDANSPVQRKLALYRTLFAGRDDVYALRWENAHNGKSGWYPQLKGDGGSTAHAIISR